MDIMILDNTIFKACYDGSLKKVKEFLANGANVNQLQVRDYVHK